jgi:hypothetical protein
MMVGVNGGGIVLPESAVESADLLRRLEKAGRIAIIDGHAHLVAADPETRKTTPPIPLNISQSSFEQLMAASRKRERRASKSKLVALAVKEEK